MHYRRAILGVNVDFGLTLDTLIDHINILFKSKKCHLIATTNPYFIMIAQKDHEFKDILNSATFSAPDGTGIIQADDFIEQSKKSNKNMISVLITGLRSGFKKKYRGGIPITGIELSDKLLELADKEGYSVFLLGGRRRDKKGHREKDLSYDMAQHAERLLRHKYKNLNIVGATSQFNRNYEDDDKTIRYIRSCMKKQDIKEIDLLLVAYGPGYQEKWIVRNSYKIPVKVSVGVGRKFDYVTGTMKEPPILYKRLRLEWLYSLVVQPWRFKRIFMSFPLFPLKVLHNVISNDNQ